MIFVDRLFSTAREGRLTLSGCLPKVTGFQMHCLLPCPALTAVWALSMGWWRGMGLRRQKMLTEWTRWKMLPVAKKVRCQWVLGQWEDFRLDAPGRFTWEHRVWGPYLEGVGLPSPRAGGSLCFQVSW